ncbi:MAG: nuclear transport factor 2 family protein [Porcipelethomonas sp.]
MKNSEIAIWEAAKNRDADAFLKLVDENAVMVCGGYRCTGKEYSRIISGFDIVSYTITEFEIVCQTEDICQVHYMIETKVSKEENKDLEGLFHITTTWKKFNGEWKAVFNMDSRVMNF